MDRLFSFTLLPIILPANATNTTTTSNTTSFTSNSTPPVLSGAPGWQRLSQLDPALYQDFYPLWVTLMVLNSVMFVVGVSLNGLALAVFCRRPPPSSAPVVYTINLAVADLLVALSLPARVALYHSGGSCNFCSYLHAFSYFVNMYCSILFLTSICVDRYLAVVVRQASRRWRSAGVARCVSAAVWLFAVVVTWSFQTTAVRSTVAVRGRLPALFALTVLEFLLPLVVILAFTLRVACALADRRLLLQSQARRCRAVRLLVTVLLVFAICFTPFHVRQALVYFRIGGEGPGQVLAYHATVTLSSLNSCLDPVVYCFVTDSFRSAVHRACRRWGGGGREAGETEGGGARGRGGGGRDRSHRGSGTAVALAHSVVTLTLTPCNPLSNDEDVEQSI